MNTPSKCYVTIVALDHAFTIVALGELGTSVAPELGYRSAMGSIRIQLLVNYVWDVHFNPSQT